MGVYINGIDIPQYGCVVFIRGDGRVTTEFGEQVIGYAVPVPPHGRLIDADALIKTFHDEYDDEEVHAFEEGAFWFHGGVMNIIDSAPTVIPADKKAGE